MTPEEEAAYIKAREAEQERQIFESMERKMGRSRRNPPVTDSEYNEFEW